MELISSIFSNTNFEEEDIPELEELEENEDSNKKYKRIKHLLVFFILGLPCIIVILEIILSIFGKH